MSKIKVSICIDPGMTTGFAVFLSNKNEPQFYGQFSRKRVNKSNDRYLHIPLLVKELDCIIDSCNANEVVIEGVSYWSSSMVSKLSHERGDAIFLSYLVGAYFYSAYKKGCTVKIVTVQQWKGQMPKSVVQARVKRAIGLDIDKKNNHACDAIGIGLSMKGIL